MDEPEKPQIAIPPLTSTTDSGEPYKRHDAVEDELRSVLPLGPAAWTARKRELKCESLVFLHRSIRRQDDHVAGVLHQEITNRTMQLGSRFIYGIYEEARNFILSEVESELTVLLLAEVPSRQSEYLEIGFGQTIYRHTLNAIERYMSTPLAHQDNSKKKYDKEDADEIRRAVEQVPDGSAGPHESLVENQTEQLWAAWVEKALKFVTNQKHREAVILKYLKGWPVTSQDPDKPCLARRFKVSARQIQNWIDIALEQMRNGMIGEGYDAATCF
jgi:hypothetical protein